MSVATIQLHLGITEKDCSKLKEDEEKRLTPKLLQDYLEGFNEELDVTAEDYLLNVIKMAYLDGFYHGLGSIGRISLNANYNEDYFYGE